MKKLLLRGIVLGVLLYTVIGFFILPYAVKFSAPNYLKENYNIEISIGNIQFNPFFFSVKFEEFILKDKNNKDLLSFETFELDIDPWKTLFNNTIYIKDFALDNTKLNIEINKDQMSNFQFLLDSFSSQTDENIDDTTKSSSLGFYLKEFALHSFYVTFKDESKVEPFVVETKAINVSLDDISLDKDHINKIDLQLDTKSSGGIHLSSKFIAQPLKVEGKVEFKDILLDKFYYYFQKSDLSLNLESKTLNSSFEYSFVSQDNKNSLNLSNIKTNLPQSIIGIDNKYKIYTEKYMLTIDQLQVFQENETFEYELSGIQSNLHKLQVEDIQNQITLEFLDLNSSIDKFSSNQTQAVGFTQTLKTQTEGIIEVKGSLIQEPLLVSGDILVKNLDLSFYKAYLKQATNIDLRSALLNTKAQFQYEKKEQIDHFDIKSDIALEKLELYNNGMEQALVKINSIDISKLHLTQDRLDIQKVLVFEPEAEFDLNKDNTTNFSKLLKQKEEKVSEQSSDERATPFAYDIQELIVKNGEFQFIDHTLEVPFHSIQKELNLTIENISSKEDQYTSIEQNSVVDQYGILQLKGRLLAGEPLKDLDMDVELQNMDLINLSSYSEKFIGNKIQKGKLFFKLNPKIKQKELNMLNKITIQDIQLGEKVESKEAIDAPIELAIALLKDPRGYINLDIPINGNLDDPKFYLSDAFFDVFRNTLIKLVASPFKVLSLVVGLDFKDDISKCYFDYGSSNINPLCKEKLDQLGEALIQRPEVEIGIKPAFVKEEDIKALKDIVFQTKYSHLLDESVELTQRIQDLSTIFLQFYTKEELDSIQLKEKEKIAFLIAKIKEKTTILDEELESLSFERAKNIKKYLLLKKIDTNRIRVKDTIDLDNLSKELQKVFIDFELVTKNK